jgi:prophage antirepressor-like protein
VYCFKAADIGKALKLTNIAVSIQHYDEDERVIRKAYDTTKRIQDTVFLTSQGVYRLLLINLNAFYFKNLFKDKMIYSSYKMTEEFKEDNNCIVKAFENNPIAILQEDVNSKKVYWFKASDIGKALNLVNIRTSIMNYDEDERTVRTTYSSSGGNPETIYLSSQGVYRLLYNSKKEVAKKFRKWAGAILDDIIFNESIELKKKLEEKDRQHRIELEEKDTLLQESSKELLRTKKQLDIKTKLKVKRWYDSEPGDTVYAVKSNKDDSKSLITIGKSKNISKRETSYMTCNQQSEMFYIRKCYNCDLAEKVIHHILDKHREENNKEWFNISNELAIYTINMVCDFLDSFIGCSEELIDLKVNEQLSICINQANIINKQEIKHDKVNDKIKEEIKHDKIIDQDDDDKSIEKFIKECCIINKDAKCISFELLGAYRIWLRGCSLDSRKKLTKYMKNNYESKTILYENYDETELLTYLGIQPREYIVQQENPDILPKYEEFILKECKIGYTYRIRWTEFLETYTKWSGNNLSKEEKVNMEAYINRHFLKDRINMTGYKNVPGIWGVQLKSDNSFKVGTNKSNRKQIIKINTETNETIEKYNGLVFASRKLNIDNRILSRDILNKKTFDIDNIKFMYKYI